MQDSDRVTYFAQTDARGKRVPFGIKREDRSRHMYVIGKTGMGKSTLLENLAIQDIQRGEGLTFIDPHGGTAEKLLEYVPEERVKDVVYFAPFDLSYPISFNVLENVEPDKRHLVINGLMATFEKIWVDAWSARMAYILQNTIAALLEWPDATLLGVNRMYTDKEFRKQVVDNVTDPSVKSFWVEEFAKYTDRFAAEATPAIQNKIGQFASNALIRNIIGQPQSSFSMRDIMDNKKIFIVNLSKGRVGEGNANMLGSMLITKLYLAAMSRADASASEMRDLPPHYLYVDEFQSFANRSFADILSEARKYKLALTIAHQYIEQMEEEVRAAVFGNVGTMITFRVGSYDAEVLEKEFAPIFTMTDIVNLGRFQIYLKLMIDGVASAPFSATTLPGPDEPADSFKTRAIAASRAQYSRPRSEVEAEISSWHGHDVGEMPLENPPARPARKKPASNQSSPPREGLREMLTKATGGNGEDPVPTAAAKEHASEHTHEPEKPSDLRATLAAIAAREQERDRTQKPTQGAGSGPEKQREDQPTRKPERSSGGRSQERVEGLEQGHAQPREKRPHRRGDRGQMSAGSAQSSRGGAPQGGSGGARAGHRESAHPSGGRSQQASGHTRAPQRAAASGPGSPEETPDPIRENLRAALAGLGVKTEGGAEGAEAQAQPSRQPAPEPAPQTAASPVRPSARARDQREDGAPHPQAHARQEAPSSAATPETPRASADPAHGTPPPERPQPPDQDPARSPSPTGVSVDELRALLSVEGDDRRVP
ncbi:type IV secretion system DNA-binding domain-containing protein [Patescibacteria group bacterium]|jgi:tRNA isopentenyl-2-thiomethyl-A-37 hydroxylase MiaE|nr:type IV secretion system DNA-binding domain-containing protein [Patescibacteria group bacterium]